MGLTQTLATSLSGLTATQTGLSIVAGNVANADTPGYVRKTLVQIPIGSGDAGIGVRVSAIQRTLDQYVQKQLRVENSGASYADLRAQFYSRLQSVYGDPGSGSSLESVYNGFTNALQALSASPDDSAARSGVISAAQQLTQSLNATSDGIQALRGAAEFGIADAVGKANEAMSADRQAQPADRDFGRQQHRHRGHARPARFLHRPAVAADGHQRHQDRQRRQHLHQFRLAAGRQPGRADFLRCRAAPLRRPRAGARTRPSARSARSS